MTDYTDEFDIFWEAYPLKKGKSKAEEYWHRHKPVLSEVLAALELQKQEKDWLKSQKKFVSQWPHGSTWVNQQRWRDGYDPDFEEHMKNEQERPLKEERERQAYFQRIREEYQAFLEGKTTKALDDLKKDKGYLVGVCGWLIDEIIQKRAAPATK